MGWTSGRRARGRARRATRGRASPSGTRTRWREQVTAGRASRSSPTAAGRAPPRATRLGGGSGSRSTTGATAASPPRRTWRSTTQEAGSSSWTRSLGQLSSSRLSETTSRRCGCLPGACTVASRACSGSGSLPSYRWSPSTWRTTRPASPTRAAGRSGSQTTRTGSSSRCSTRPTSTRRRRSSRPAWPSRAWRSGSRGHGTVSPTRRTPSSSTRERCSRGCRAGASLRLCTGWGAPTRGRGTR
mmetsp:Transcript_12893/g.29249  ORF Transcript_12893/g.29249 Transcript_12893/m.29249 type:complete len:243 (-) Transcript_12893:321-1049(-)